MAKTKIDRIAMELAQLRKEKRDDLMQQARVKISMPECDRALVRDFKEMKAKLSRKGVFLDFGLPKEKKKK